MKEKCFAEIGDKCKTLNIKKCKGCNFYKTHEEARISRKKAKDRLKSLDKATRLGIAEKYGIKEIV
jgi:NurA-like 5'-3' nuclease